MTYNVKEKSGSLGGVTYDPAEHTVTVTITDKGDGTLQVIPSNNFATLNFTNPYAATGSLMLTATKTLTGRILAAGEIELELYEGATLLETVTNAADGSVSFATLNYTLNDVGTKTYTVKEKSGSLNGVTYTVSVYTVTVTITDKGDGTLLVVPSDNAATMAFDKTYVATGSLALSGTKTLTGRNLAAGEFEFELYEGATLLETVTNAADGSVKFTALK